jgi:hypothetical protein
MGIFDIFQSKKSLKRKIKTIEQEIKKTVSMSFSGKFSILRYGAYDIDPKHLVFWICVDTDEIKDKLENDKDLNNELRNIFVKNEYPKDSINNVHIGFESQETVDRESNGDWYMHFK